MSTNVLTRDWGRWGGTWDIDLRPNIIKKPFSGLPMITIPQREHEIKGTISKQVLKCQSDFDELVAWFNTGNKIIKCPVFDTAPIVAGDMASVVMKEVSGLITIGWTYKGVDTGYRFRSVYFLGALATSLGGLLAAPIPNTSYSFGVNIRPVERGFNYTHKTANFWEIDAIEFMVVPHDGWYI